MQSNTLFSASEREIGEDSGPQRLSQNEFGVLSPTDEAILAKLFAVQKKLLMVDQMAIQTDHVLHAGMYLRTMTLDSGMMVIGALIKIPTVVIVVGSAKVYTGEWLEVNGYSVLRASAHRKQIFVSLGPLIVTMAFPTEATTVEDAEREFTDEHELLLSRRNNSGSTVIGE